MSHGCWKVDWQRDCITTAISMRLQIIEEKSYDLTVSTDAKEVRRCGEI